jgi:hypothetical protein
MAALKVRPVGRDLPGIDARHRNAVMSFVVSGLPIETFRPLFGLSDEALAERGVIRRRVDSTPGFPCRITLEDA